MGATWLSTIPQVQERTHEQLAKLVRDAAEDIRDHAKAIVPVDTGFLKSSIEAEHSEELLSVVNVGADYGIYVEMGTYKMAAQPYIGPAVDAVIGEIDGKIQKILT